MLSLVAQIPRLDRESWSVGEGGNGHPPYLFASLQEEVDDTGATAPFLFAPLQ